MDNGLYNNLIKTVELEDLNVKELTMNCHVPEEKVEGIHASVGVGVGIEYFNSTHLGAVVNFDIEAVNQDNENQKVFEMGFVYILRYRTEGLNILESDEETVNQALDIFSKENIPINVWPFARELVAEMTRRMGLPPFIMGMYRFFPDATKKKSDENAD